VLADAGSRKGNRMKSWVSRLQDQYPGATGFVAFQGYCIQYNLHVRLGFNTPENAWDKNPLIGGSSNPSDFGLVKLDEFTTGYITCALWSSHGGKYGKCPCCGRMAVLDRYPEKEYEEQAMCRGDGCGVREMNCEPPLDDNYDIDDISPTTLAEMVNDCAKFQEENSELLAKVDYKIRPDGGSEMSYAGHDFWLTRCGHGAGFWDGDLEEDLGDKLTEACKKYKEVDLYVGDDGKIYS
jgi:hypothetical protein